MHVRCPHRHNSIDLADFLYTVGALTCPHRGSIFRLDAMPPTSSYQFSGYAPD